MKQSLAVAIALLAAVSAFAGLTYDFKSVTGGNADQTIAGSVRAEGPNMRIDFTTGDGTLFTTGSYALSTGGSKLMVADPAAKTYYELDTDALLGGADALLGQFGGAVKFEVTDPKVHVTSSGAAGTMAGFPAQKSRVDSSYSMVMDAFGQKINIAVEMGTDVWWTDKIPAEAMNFLQMRSFRTGVEAVDKMLAAQTSAVKGFPLKQVTTTKIVMNNNPITTTSTSEVTNVKQGKVEASVFAKPTGLKKIDSPLDGMLKQ